MDQDEVPDRDEEEERTIREKQDKQRRIFINIGTGFGATLIAAFVFFKISFDISVRQLKKYLPEAEYKIQLAIAKLEAIQANKLAINEFNRKKRRMKELKPGVTIDIDDNESVIDQLEEERTPRDLSSDGLSEKGKAVLSENPQLQQSILAKINKDAIKGGIYELESDLTRN